MPIRAPVQPDPATLEQVIRLLDDRLQAVVTYGAGGCPTCHDAELRSAIVVLRRLLAPPEAAPAGRAVPVRRGGRPPGSR